MVEENLIANTARYLNENGLQRSEVENVSKKTYLQILLFFLESF